MTTNEDLLDPLIPKDSKGEEKRVTFYLPDISIHAKDEEKEGFSPLIAVCFTVNYLVGTGFLTLPWAFVQGGLILSTILLLVATGISDVAKDFLLEAMARAEAVVPLELGNNENDIEVVNNEIDETEEGPLIVKERKFEMTDLCRIFMGEKAAKIFISCLSFSLFMTLWAYTVVFVTTLQDEFTGTGDKDLDADIYVLVFALIVVPLSCLELKEQIFIQVTLAFCRVLMLVFMVSTTLLFPDDFRDKQYNPNTNPFREVPLFNVAGFSQAFPIILFALGFQIAIPGISQAVTDKRQLSGIFRTTFLLCAMAYILVGVSVPLATGQTVAQSSNVMWSNFRAGTGELNEDGEYVGVVWWAQAISFFVVTFPAIDVISAFPLNAIVLGSNLLDALFKGESHLTTVSYILTFDIYIHKYIIILLTQIYKRIFHWKIGEQKKSYTIPIAIQYSSSFWSIISQEVGNCY